MYGLFEIILFPDHFKIEFEVLIYYETQDSLSFIEFVWKSPYDMGHMNPYMTFKKTHMST